MTDAFANFASNIVAAMIGGFMALAGVLVTHGLDRKRAHEEQEEIARRFLLALVDELDTVWKSYQEDIGGDVEALKDGDYLT